jgi:hypothetical protein
MKEGELCIRLEASLADGKALEGLPRNQGTAQTQAHLAQHSPHRTHPSTRDRDADRRRKDDYPSSCCSPKRREVEVELMSSTSSNS